jgi:SnoaL-like domain
VNELTTEDERQIAAVIVRYGTGIDTRNWTLFRSCFADDVKADYGPFGTWSSADDITTSMEAMHAEVGPTLHRMTNVVAAMTETGATARTYVDAVLMPIAPDGDIHQACGVYDDNLVHTDIGWKIQQRIFTVVRFS